MLTVLKVEENTVETAENPRDDMLFTLNLNSNLNSWSAG